MRVTSSRDPKVPRSTRGTDDDVWVPGHVDRRAAVRLWEKDPTERLDIIRRLAICGITRSQDPDVVAAAYLVLDAIADRNPGRIIRDAGLAVAGGAHSIRSQENRKWRDAALRGLWRQEYPSTLDNPYAAARKMLSEFTAYETRRWPRDQQTQKFPQAGAEKLWADILRRGVHMPRSEQQLVNILSKTRSRD